MAWQHITPEVNVKGLSEVLYIQCTDDALWNGSEEDGNVGAKCEEGEGTDSEDGDSDINW
jgi:hypothetical protein